MSIVRILSSAKTDAVPKPQSCQHINEAWREFLASKCAEKETTK